MLGPPKLRSVDQPVTISLEALVPADHFYRHLGAVLGLSFVRDWVADCYAACGRPSIDPVVFFKLQFVLFFEGLRSGRKLMETVALNLAHRWYLGYRLDEPLTDHSSLTRIRERPAPVPLGRVNRPHMGEVGRVLAVMAAHVEQEGPQADRDPLGRAALVHWRDLRASEGLRSTRFYVLATPGITSRANHSICGRSAARPGGRSTTSSSTPTAA